MSWLDPDLCNCCLYSIPHFPSGSSAITESTKLLSSGWCVCMQIMEHRYHLLSIYRLGIVLSALLACLILTLEPRGRWYYSHCTSERMEAYTSRLLAFSPEASKWRHWDYCPGCLTPMPVLSPQALPNSGPSVLEYQKLWNFCKQTLSNFSLHQYWPPVWSLFHR